MPTIGWVILVVGLFLIFFFSSIKVVRTKYCYVVERIGQFHRVLEPGVHLIIPFIDNVRAKVNMQERILDVPPQDVITKDNVRIKIDSVVFFEVFDAKMCTYNIQNYQAAIMYSVLTNLRDVVGNMTLDEIFSSREVINSRLTSVLDQITDNYGVKVKRVEIKDIIPPAEITQAMEKQMKAERDKRAMILEAEGVRESEIAKAEGYKQALIKRAEGEKQQKILQAEGQAQAIEMVAKAQANAIAYVNRAIKESGTDAVVLAMRQIEAAIEIAKNPANKVYIPTDAFKNLGTLIGASELIRTNDNTNSQSSSQ
jgi:regulator of protease activity HflC (stomatin/prohibitin superfamily)